jgi:hypothetical protein
VTPGQHIPPEYGKGDETTVAGYAAVHSRPAALEGRDGMSYSLDLLTDATGDAARPFGAYLIFVRWSRGISKRISSPGATRPATRNARLARCRSRRRSANSMR